MTAQVPTTAGPIVTLTPNPTVDLSWDVGRLRSEGKVRATSRGVSAGGGGINVARVVHDLGGAATAVVAAGGLTGERLLQLLDDEGIDHRDVAISGETRLAVVLTEREDDRSYHLVPEGPRLSRDETDRLIDAVTACLEEDGLVVASGSMAPGSGDDFYARAAEAVGSRNARLVLDTSGEALRAALEEGVHLVKLNRKEAGELLGEPVDSFDDARRFNEGLVDGDRAAVVITTVGEHGAMCTTRSGSAEVHTPPLPRPAHSDAGAGDSLLGGLCTALAEGEQVIDACRWGVAAASSTVSTSNTSPGGAAEIAALARQVDVVHR